MKKEKTKTILMLGLFASVVLQCSEANAQTPDSAASKQLNEVTITATRSAKDPASVGRSVTVITADQMKNSVYNSVAELLSQQEGIYIVGTGQNPGMTQSVFTRGANSNHTVILIDGNPLSDPSAINNSIDLTELSLSNVERIEIVRGAHSTLYGSSAIGGAINIITKKNAKPGFHADADLKAGSLGKGTSTASQDINLNYSLKKGFYVGASLLNSGTKGLDATVDTITAKNAEKFFDKDNFKKLELQGKLGFKNEKWDVFAGYRKLNQETDFDKQAYKYNSPWGSYPNAWYDGDNTTLDFSRQVASFGLGYRFSDKISLNYSGAYSSMERKEVNDSSVVDSKGNYDHSYNDGTYEGTTFNNDLQFNAKLKGIELVLGGGQFKQTMTAKTYVYSNDGFLYTSKTNLDSLDLGTTTSNGFIHADVNGSLVSEKAAAFSIALGARFNNHSSYGNNFTYEINPSLKINETGLLFASYSTGFNAPSLYQLYTPEKDAGSKIQRGNANLKPETAVSMEFGFKQKVNESVSLSMSYFKTEVENNIEYVYLWDKDTAISDLDFDDYKGDIYLNLGKQTNQGIEISVSSKLGEKVSVFGNVSLVNGKMEYEPGEIDTAATHGNHVQLYSNGAFVNKNTEALGLVRRPNSANLGIAWMPCKKITLRADARYAGSRNDVYYNATLGPFGALATQGVAEYVLMDASVKYMYNEHFNAIIRVENIFDTKYSEINGFTTRGRGVHVGLRLAM